MPNALIVQDHKALVAQNVMRAAQYVRMSTDKQRYSIQNQAATIAAYAHAHNLSIVRTYADEGESGLHIKNRAGLRQLISDISAGTADYGHLLIYDVSRWGRFQDTDESAHYEFVCRQAGVKVEYCAEQFDNDGTMLASIVKNLKRVMAAEYSRDLSVRIHAAQSRIVSLGFRHGAQIVYGLRREVVDEQHQHKGFLVTGERKYLQTDRVRVRQGPEDEIFVVRWIFDQRLQGKSDTQIALDLNRQAIPTGNGRPWKRGIISRMLRNESYVGNIVYNRQSAKLGGRRVLNPVDLWVRNEGCIEPVVSQDVFQRAKKIAEGRCIIIGDDEMLMRLRRALHQKGALTTALIDGTRGLPRAHTYARRFGSLRNAYKLIGYRAKRDYAFFDAELIWTEVRNRVLEEVAACLEKSGVHVLIGKDQLKIDQSTSALFRVARALPLSGRLTQWRIPRLRKTGDRWLVVIRLTEDNKSVLDYLTMPTKGLLESCPSGDIRFTDQAQARLRFNRFDTVQTLAASVPLSPPTTCSTRKNTQS